MTGKNNWRWLDDESDLPSIERINQRDNVNREPEATEEVLRRDRSKLENPSFRCCHCKAWVESDPEVAGVKHRNHCPYCLYSRHLDENKPGDRRSDCRSAMQPVGLTIKPSGNKYGSTDGELMLIHLCLNCCKLSINRIAADDNAERILAVFEASARPEKDLRMVFAQQGIRLLHSGDLNLVLMRLYGAPNIDLALKIPVSRVRAKV